MADEKGISEVKEIKDSYEKKKERVKKIVDARTRLKRKKFDPALVENLRKSLLGRMKRKAEADFQTARAFIEGIIDLIRELRKRAYTFEEISANLKEDGFDISPIEIEMVLQPQNYILKRRGKRGEAKGTTAESAKVPDQQTATATETKPPPLPAPAVAAEPKTETKPEVKAEARPEGKATEEAKVVSPKPVTPTGPPQTSTAVKPSPAPAEGRSKFGVFGR